MVPSAVEVDGAEKTAFFLFCFDEEENMIGFEGVELVVGREGGKKKFFANLPVSAVPPAKKV